MKTTLKLTTALFVLAPLGLLGIAGCQNGVGALCDKSQECATKAGTAFSRTECENNLKTDQEKADSLGCSGEYDAVLGCIADLDCGVTLSQINANCGAQIKALEKCEF